MVILKKKYFLIIENIKDISLENIKKRFKFNIIYRNNKKLEDLHRLRIFRKECKSKDIKFFVANDYNLSSKLKADGIYLSAFNKDLKYLNYMKSNFIIIGGAHNIKEINLKIKQGCKYILLSRLFKVSYKPEMNYLGINKFNFYASNIFKNIVALGGINTSNINKIKIVNCDSFALMTEIKKKPAKIFSRLF